MNIKTLMGMSSYFLSTLPFLLKHRIGPIMNGHLDRYVSLYIYLYIFRRSKTSVLLRLCYLSLCMPCKKHHLKIFTTWSGRAVRFQFSVLVCPLYW